MRIDDDTMTGREAVIDAISDSLHYLTDRQLLDTMDAIRSIRSVKSEDRNALIQRINKAIKHTDYPYLLTLATIAEGLQRK